MLLVGSQRQTGVRGAGAERQLVGQCHAYHAGYGAQRNQVFAGACIGVVTLPQPAHSDLQKFLLGDATGKGHAVETLGNQEQGVADNGAGQRHLKHDQRARSLVAPQAG